MSQYEVSVFPAQDYSEMQAAVKAHFEALDIAALVNPGSKVVLKPNLLMKRSPDRGTTTHPALVSAVIECLKDLGVSDIVIADSPGGPYTKSALEGVYNACGMADAAKAGARLNFDTSYSEIKRGDKGLCRSFEIITPACGADLIINLPKLKTHAMAGLSAAVKNLLGCVPGLRKAEFHMRFPSRDLFAQMLVELTQTLPPIVSIVDAVVSMEGDGPSSGTLRHTGITFASRDLHALDFALCHYIGAPPESIDTVRFAMNAGISPKTLDEIHFLGDEIPVIEPFIMPASRGEIGFASVMPGILKKPFNWFSSKFLQPRPVVDKAKCIGCKKCAESCAAGAISFDGGKAVIDYSKCIRCFCCHEMCPVSIIGIKKSKLFHF